MQQRIAPIPCKPWSLNGLSERLIVSHYENNYGAAIRSLNAIRDHLKAIDLAAAPGHEVRALKQEELDSAGSVAVLGGLKNVEDSFPSGSAHAIWGQDCRVGSTPELLARQLEQCGRESRGVAETEPDPTRNHRSRAERYRGITWSGPVREREAVLGVRRCLGRGEPVQVLDARPRHYFSRVTDMMEGAIWRDPEWIEEWCARALGRRPRGRLLRLWIPCRLRSDGEASRAWLRRALRQGWAFRMVRHGRRPRAAAGGRGERSGRGNLTWARHDIATNPRIVG
jgi:hypothetical protein